MRRILVVVLFACLCLMASASCNTTVPSSPLPTSLTPTDSTPWPSPSHGFSTPALPSLPADDKETVDKSIVVVYGSDGKSATGVVVGDGSQVLTTWDFEASQADGFKIMAPGGTAYESSIQAFDSRTAMLLLRSEGMKLPAAPIGDIQTLKSGQEVIAREWNLPGDFIKVHVLASVYPEYFPLAFFMSYPPEAFQANEVTWVNQGAIVTDLKGSLLGVVGVDYMTLMAHPHPSGFIPGVAGVIPAAGVLSSNAAQQLWVNGPLQFLVANQSGTRGTVYLQNYDAVTQAIKDLESNLGASLAASELGKYYVTVGAPSDGVAVTTAYAWPVNLFSTDGKLLTSARWVSIQWNRGGNKPNCIFYGSKYLNIDGGFQIAGNINTLAQAVSSLIP